MKNSAVKRALKMARKIERDVIKLDFQIRGSRGFLGRVMEMNPNLEEREAYERNQENQSINNGFGIMENLKNHKGSQYV